MLINNHQVQQKSLPGALVMVCIYVFLVIERPWESIRYLNDFPIERPFAIILVVVSLITGKFKIKGSDTNKWVYGLLMLHFLLVPFSYIPTSALDQSIEYLKIILLYLLMLSLADDEYTLKVILKAFAFSMMIYAFHSLWEYHNGRHVYRMGIVRMVGVDSTYNDPNSFGASLLLSLPIIYALLRSEYNRLIKLLLYLYFGIALLCIFLTGSRSAFIGLVVLFTFLGLLQKGYKKLLICLLLLASFVGVWHVFTVDQRERILSIWDENAGPENAHTSAEGRIKGFKAGMAMFQKMPFTGVGPGGSNFVEYRLNHLDGIPEQSHNLYAEILGEFGAGGGILFTGLICSIFKCCLRSRKIAVIKGDGMKFIADLSMMIMLCLLLLLILGLAGHNFYRPLWLWIAAWSGSLARMTEQTGLGHQASS